MKICVIGAGSSGLTSIKACKEENLDVDCFEASDNFGGLWRFHDDTEDGKPSVMKSTVINTSKEMSAFSDFPPPEEFANFMHNTYMLEYFRQYAKRFDLLKHIKYKCKVINVEKATDYELTGRWLVTVLDLGNGVTFTNTYDGVMVCTGHHTFPYYPDFEGLDDFQGTVKHTHSLKTDKGYEDKAVLVVGIGNSGVDAAVEICPRSKKVYLSTRRGSWIYTRLLFGGMLSDMFFLKRMFNIFFFWNLRDTFMEFFLNLKFDHEKCGLKPNHRATAAHVTINDALPNFILSGRVVLKQNVEKFTKNGVIFEGEEDATLIDDLILATGYEIKYAFLSEDIIQVKRNSVNFYKLVFPAHLQHPSLAFIGLIQPLGSIFPIAEAQARWYAQLMKRKCTLPTTDEMKKEVIDRQEKLSKRYVSSPRHTIQVDFISYMDELCTEFGAKPNFWKMALTDPVLFYACLTGSCVPYQYRLQGPHAWDGARDAIMTVNKRVEAPLKTNAPFKYLIKTGAK